MPIHFKLRKLYANFAAFRGKDKSERRQIRRRILSATRDDDTVATPHSESDIYKLVQDHTFPGDLLGARRLIVMLVPEHNTMSGGIYSFFSIVEQMRRLKSVHGHEVITVTRPNPLGETYFRNTNFRNSENVYRFSQLLLCKQADEIYLQLPEYAAATFFADLAPRELDYLAKRKVRINILNQNVQLMPERNAFEALTAITPHLSQSVAHHAYFTQAAANRYRLPTLLLPAYTDLSAYPGCPLAQKEKLIIYSLDEASHKQACLAKIASEFPNYQLVEIRGITFDKFMDLATRCTFSITFGEGFDGYLAQPTLQGGIGFAVFNDEFFPSRHFLDYENIFESADAMVAGVCDVMRQLLADPERYCQLNAAFAAEYDALYSKEEYTEKVRKLTLGEFEIFPEEP